MILGLDAGANDYVVKPFRLGLLLARLRAQLRQYERSDDVTLPLGPYLFLAAAKRLISTANGRMILLTEKEAAILKHLYREPERMASRGHLMQKVWRYNPEARSHTLSTHIYRLRRKIETDPANPKILVSFRGGYRLCVDPATGVQGALDPVRRVA